MATRHHHHATSAAPGMVLTNAALFSLIASFQRGLPGAVAPLVRRLEADGWMRRTTRYVYVRGLEAPPIQQSVACVVSRISGTIWPPRQWHTRCALEACALYDDHDRVGRGFRVLRLVLGEITNQPTRKARARANEHAQRRVWHAAAASGRVEVLRWMHATYNCVGSVLVLLRRCASLAMRFGHVNVHEWIENTFGTKKLRRVVLSPRQVVNASDAAAHGHVQVFHWLQDRRLKFVVDGAAMRTVVERGDVDTLRILHDHHFIHRRNHALVAYAVASDQAAALAFLVNDCRLHATLRTLERALSLGCDAAVACLLEHRDALRRDVSGDGTVPHHMVQRIISHGLTGETVTHRAVRLLLPLYPTDAIAAVLVNHAVREHVPGASQLWQLAERDALPALVGEDLPLTVITFARRVRSDTLGPLATAVKRWRHMRFTDTPMRFQSEVERLQPAATLGDAHDAMLLLLFQGAHIEIQSLLDGDTTQVPMPYYDAPFLRLCAGLCDHGWYQGRTKAVFTDHLEKLGVVA